VADIVLINPRFEPSYWGLEEALPLLGRRANMPVSSLPLLAALTPAGHTVTLLDENVEPLDLARCARADVVGLTGLSVQRFRMREVLTELKRRGAFTAVGGAWVTVQEDYFGGLADVIFVGEAEETWPQFLADWSRGRHRPRYEQAEKSDLTRLPTPRFDLLKLDRYLFGAVQFSRGCPFQCEFCDIIVTFGRRPRLKTAPQVLAELEALRAGGVRMAFIVDDNLIGNKRAIRGLLEAVRDWQQARGYPLTFFTEASVDLADDPDLLRLLTEVNLVGVFLGIESPNEASLRETKKFQNVRAGGTLLEKVRRIQRAGLDVWCGMILGFDHDDPGIFDAQRAFLGASRITSAMVGMLAAIPKTPLYARLAAEGRLDLDDRPAFGTNVIPLRMSRAELRDGYLAVMADLYEPRSYFDRLDELVLGERLLLGNRNCPGYWRRHPLRFLATQAADWARALVLRRRLLGAVPDRALRAEYRRRIDRVLRSRRDGGVSLFYVIKCAMHHHVYQLVQRFRRDERALVNSL
jgi:radical SAM superfamily enzyme YgiQ (UPF0313 family)